MPEFRYQLSGSWYKGNTHIHSTASDGRSSFSQLAQEYAGAGYDFLFRTDHWVASDTSADAQEYPLLWLDGIELDGTDSRGAYFHVVGLGRLSGIERGMGFENAMQVVRAQGGLLILAHPQWTGNSFDDALRWQFDGIEVHNHICQWLNGKGNGSAYWNAALKQAPLTLGLAVDDAHISPEEPGWNGGWVVVNAVDCTSESILAGLRAGNFYASCGPVIEDIRCDGRTVTLECSPVQFIRLVGPAWRGERVGFYDDNHLTTATFEVPADWDYAYLEIEDDHGRRAWTNSLFTTNDR